MHYYSHAKCIDVYAVNGLFFVIGDNLRCYKPRSSAFGKYDSWLAKKCC